MNWRLKLEATIVLKLIEAYSLNHVSQVINVFPFPIFKQAKLSNFIFVPNFFRLGSINVKFYIFALGKLGEVKIEV